MLIYIFDTLNSLELHVMIVTILKSDLIAFSVKD